MSETTKVYVPYDPDFDQSQPQEVIIEERIDPERNDNKNNMTFSISLTPWKIFFGGLVVGVLLMGIPTTYFALRAQGSTGLALGNGAGNTAPTAPAPAPSPTPSQQPPANGSATGTVKPVGSEDRVRGNKNAKVSFVEYSDLECPFCKRFHPTVEQAFNEYKDKVKFVFRHFPLSFHANAVKEAEAAECAGAVGGEKKYFEYIDKMFERTTSGGTGFALDQLTPLAKELGMNETKFKECFDGGKFAKKVQNDLNEGQTAGVDGTPGSIVLGPNGKNVLVSGAVPYSEVKAAIDKMLSE
ncbi:thioredoxin domain-containing protein [Candidatus Uhrbacteria bacterium]|nr:thioredoxin domain-containing protein [Candidatus Uhrbacteria bacterium]